MQSVTFFQYRPAKNTLTLINKLFDENGEPSVKELKIGYTQYRLLLKAMPESQKDFCIKNKYIPYRGLRIVEKGV